jgi:hypothetical protein
MDKGTFGARTQRAHDTILSTTKVLAERFTLPGQAEAFAAIQGPDRAVRGLKETEAVANLLTQLVAATEPKAKSKAKAEE